MRVISGSARGLKLKSPKGLNTRPTADRIKESLFNIISPYLDNISFLDLFSGSGAIGIEALSRGAKYATFVDIDKQSISIINQNIASARFIERSTVHNIDCIDAINMISLQNLKFDIIFLDPPYSKRFLEPTINKIEEKQILKNDGFIICEQRIDEIIFETEKLIAFRVKEYKITKMVFLKWK